MTDRRLPLLFALAVLLHAAFAMWVGQPGPAGRYQDVNVYLELAQNLWREGAFLTRVNHRPYPPGYPLFLAPTFAIESNVLRFAVTYAMHALALGLASLTLLPMLRDAWGRRRAWWAVILLQGLAGASFTLVHAQSEALYTPLVVAATGLLYQAFRGERAGATVLAGAVVGYAVVTRRIGAVAPIALVLVVLQDLVGAWRGGKPLPLRRAGLLALGMLVGVLPEWVAAQLHGEVVEAYPEYTETYAATGKAMFQPEHLLYAVRTAASQGGYYLLTTLAAPALLLAWLVGPSDGTEVERARRRAATWVGWAALGTAALTTLHIVRHVLGTNPGEGFSTYPRYLDPFELPLVVCGVLAATLLQPDARRRVLGWAAAGIGLAWLAGPWYRTRAGRIVPVDYFEAWGFGPFAPWVVAIGTCVVIGLGVWMWERRTGPLRLLGAAVALSWLISLHTPVSWIQDGLTFHRATVLLRKGPVHVEDGPVCVLVHSTGRQFYALAFRTDHEVWFARRNEIARCVEEHDAAWVVARRSARWKPKRAGLDVGERQDVTNWHAWPVKR